MVSQRSCPVSELDSDDDQTGRRELIAPALVARVIGSKDDHATAMGVNNARQGAVGIVWLVDVQVDVVAVCALDDFGV
jgi:hypothetical protein